MTPQIFPVFVCVREKKSVYMCEIDREKKKCVCVCVCVSACYVCVREKKRVYVCKTE